MAERFSPGPEQIIDKEIEKKESFDYGIKFPEEFYKDNKIDQDRVATEIDNWISQGVHIIEIPHNLNKSQLSEEESKFWAKIKAQHPELRLTIHENINKIWPYDYEEMDENQNFEPKVASVWAHRLNNNDIEKLVESACDAIDQAKNIGAEVITIHPIGAIQGYAPNEFTEYDRIYTRAIGKYLDVVNKDTQNPIRVGMENFVFRHGQEVSADPTIKAGTPEYQGNSSDFRSPNELKGQINVNTDTDSPYMGYTLDIGHAYWSEQGSIEKILQAIEQLGKKLVHVHMHDTVKAADKHLQPTKGEVDFKPILNKLHEIGYSGILEVEVNKINESTAGIKSLQEIDEQIS